MLTASIVTLNAAAASLLQGATKLISGWAPTFTASPAPALAPALGPAPSVPVHAVVPLVAAGLAVSCS